MKERQLAEDVRQRQRLLGLVGGGAGRLGHDLLSLTVPLRAFIESAARDGVETHSAPEACRLIERVGQGLQLLAAKEQVSVTADLGAVFEMIEPVLRATLPRGMRLSVSLDPARQVVPAGRESVAQAIFRCAHALAGAAGAGEGVAICGRRPDGSEHSTLRFSLDGKGGKPGDLAGRELDRDLLPGPADSLLERLGGTIEVGRDGRGPAIVLTIRGGG